MLQNPCKTLGFKKNMVYKIPPGGGGGKPYPASGLKSPNTNPNLPKVKNTFWNDTQCRTLSDCYICISDFAQQLALSRTLQCLKIFENYLFLKPSLTKSILTITYWLNYAPLI